jgi:hypothetical protein
MFNVDDTANQPLADAYGIVMGTSHTGECPITNILWDNTENSRTNDASNERVE